jgi:hypothetical protein
MTATRARAANKVLVGLAAALSVAALPAASAAAFPRFWTDHAKTTPLRDLATRPKLTPDFLEFANQGSVRFSAAFPTGKDTVVCNELELGAALIINNGVEEAMLSVPFGVFEGDQCSGSNGALVPTRFETLPVGLGLGAVGVSPKIALITVTGGSAPFTATVHYVRVWQDFAGKFCAWNLHLIHGLIENASEGFVEEAPPNLSLKFPEVEVPITNAPRSSGCPNAGRFEAARLFLETTSSAGDTAFVG